MSEMQGLGNAIRPLAAVAKDKIDDALLSESPDQIKCLLAEVRDSIDAMVEAVDGAADTNETVR
jgi:hypothetical protein